MSEKAFKWTKLKAIGKIGLILAIVFPGQTLGFSHHNHRRRETTTTREGDGAGTGPAEEEQRHGPTVFHYQCPQGCHCEPDNVHNELLMVTCRWTRIRPRSSFAQFPRNGTKRLTIQCGGRDGEEKEEEEEGEGEEGMFEGFDKLQELRISGCPASGWALPPRALFRSVPLRLLHLSQVPSLHSLSPEFFADLRELEQFTLSGTELEQFPADALCALKALQVLNVSDNRLSSARLSLSPDQCQLGQLIMADLSGNRIRTVDNTDLAPFPALQILALADNEMEKMDSDAFAGLRLLRNLDLSRNFLSALPPLPPTILHLDLSHNKFRRFVPPSVRELGALKELSMSANAIDEADDSGSSEYRPLRSNSLEKLDLSWNGLRHVPIRLLANSLGSVRHLGLAGNGIERMEPGGMAKLSALKQLDLSHNRLLGVLSAGVFEGLDELQMLSMDNNSVSGMDEELFAGVGAKLHSLGMSHNALTELPAAIRHLQRIRRMDFSHNRINKTHKFVLNKLPHLAKLDLSSNWLDSLDSYVFTDCVHLTELVLARNRIRTVSSDAFGKCPRLRRMDLADNQIAHLSGSLAQVHTLRWVNLSGNTMEELDWAQFPAELLELEANGNRILRIRELEMEEDGGEVEARRKLKKMELKRNKLGTLSMDSLPNSLEELDVSQNELSQLLVASSHNSGRSQLKMLNVRSNRLRTIPRQFYDQTVGANAPFGQLWIGDNPLECDCEMGWLVNASKSEDGGGGGGGGVPDMDTARCLVPMSGERRLVRETQPTDFLCPYSQLCGSSCGCCQFMNCDCKVDSDISTFHSSDSRCPPGCHCFRDQSAATNVVKCQGDTVGADFNIRDLPMPASHVLLSSLSSIPVLKSKAFSGRKQLLELHINASGIHTIEADAFHKLENLRVLHLSGNQLERINGNEGNKIPNIRLLDINGNKVVGVDPELGEMAPKLERLHMADNLLEELPRYLQSSFGAQLKHISLAGNPFRCDCAAIKVENNRHLANAVHWLDRNFARVLDPEGMLCVENVTRAKLLNDTTVLSTEFPNDGGADLFVMPMLEFLREENKSLCIDHSTGIFGVAGVTDTLQLIGTILCISMVLLALLYMVNRMKLRSSSDDSVITRLIINNNTTNNSMSSSHYSPRMSGGSSPEECRGPLLGQAGPIDMFVIYHQTDETMLRKFCKRLEDKRYSLRLLHHCHGDLNSLLEKSRAIVMFVTPEFLKKEWQTLESTIKENKKHNNIVYVDHRLDDKMDGFPEELGAIILKRSRMWQKGWKWNFNDNSFWIELDQALSLIYGNTGSHPSKNDSEYATIPQVPSEII